jgi:hypothetical protein
VVEVNFGAKSALTSGLEHRLWFKPLKAAENTYLIHTKRFIRCKPPGKSQNIDPDGDSPFMRFM